MVLYFTSTAVDPPAYVYVGKDKFESRSAFADAFSATRGDQMPDAYPFR